MMKDFLLKYGIELVLGGIVTYLVARIKVLKTKYDSIQTGMQSLLRAELIRSGEKYLNQGWIEVYAKDAYDKAYLAYHGLGGNGTMTEMHTTVMNLPTIKPTNDKRKD